VDPILFFRDEDCRFEPGKTSPLLEKKRENTMHVRVRSWIGLNGLNNLIILEGCMFKV
jgi:hypothetical protein